MNWNILFWGCVFCVAMWWIAKQYRKQPNIIDVNSAVSFGAILILGGLGLTLGVAYVGIHLIYLFSDWSMLVALLCVDAMALPYLLGIMFLGGAKGGATCRLCGKHTSDIDHNGFFIFANNQSLYICASCFRTLEEKDPSWRIVQQLKPSWKPY